MSLHDGEGDDEHDREHDPAQHERHPQAGDLGDVAAGDRPGQHRHPGDHLAAAEDLLQLSGEPGRLQRVHQPGLDRPGEEGEAEPQQQRDDRPGPERPLDLPQHHVEDGGDRERDRAEQVGDPAPDRVGDDPGRDLEDQHAGGEEGVGGEGLEVVEARVEQEDRVDPPDERGGERVAQQQHVVDALDGAGRGHHYQPSGASPASRCAYRAVDGEGATGEPARAPVRGPGPASRTCARGWPSGSAG